MTDTPRPTAESPHDYAHDDATGACSRCGRPDHGTRAEIAALSDSARHLDDTNSSEEWDKACFEPHIHSPEPLSLDALTPERLAEAIQTLAHGKCCWEPAEDARAILAALTKP